VIDLKKLCIKEGEQVWSVLLDICTINDAGNLLDACSIAALAALKDTKLPVFDGTEIDYGTKTSKSLPLSHVPISVTVHKIGSYFLVDPDSEEEKLIDARLTVALKSNGSVCAFQKGGDSPVTSDDVCTMVDIAQEIAGQVRPQLER